jgi:3-deoxy-D-manno-octulosonate 8-phosphate phosphatase (KDO 8-P phosphatase)
MEKTKFFVMDVDGTLTDGRIYMGQDGEMVKAFSIKDGAGISMILPKMGVLPVIITARESRILQNRCMELGITELHQGSKDKLKTLKGILERYGAEFSSVAYAGDDLPDIPCMEEIKRAGGAILCPANAIPEIKILADYVSGYEAGDGAIRDCINYLAQRSKDCVEERVKQAVDWILTGEYKDGFLPDGSEYSIQEYMTKAEADCILESHRRHVDIQYMLEGNEEFKLYASRGLTSTGTYYKEKDAEFWQSGVAVSHSVLTPGSLIVVYANQPHKGAIVHVKPEHVKKLVCKILVCT